jgi:hypothetical protein
LTSMSFAADFRVERLCSLSCSGPPIIVTGVWMTTWNESKSG